MTAAERNRQIELDIILEYQRKEVESVSLRKLLEHKFTMIHPMDVFGWLRNSGLRCVSCGEDLITQPILRFFGYNVSIVKCYKCQNNNK